MQSASKPREITPEIKALEKRYEESLGKHRGRVRFGMPANNNDWRGKLKYQMRLLRI